MTNLEASIQMQRLYKVHITLKSQLGPYQVQIMMLPSRMGLLHRFIVVPFTLCT